MIYDNLFEESVICRGKMASKLIYISINKDKEIVYGGNKFFVNKNFKDYITMLSKTKRYNIRTDKHIINKTNFDKNIWTNC